MSGKLPTRFFMGQPWPVFLIHLHFSTSIEAKNEFLANETLVASTRLTIKLKGDTFFF